MLIIHISSRANLVSVCYISGGSNISVDSSRLNSEYCIVCISFPLVHLWLLIIDAQVYQSVQSICDDWRSRISQSVQVDFGDYHNPPSLFVFSTLFTVCTRTHWSTGIGQVWPIIQCYGSVKFAQYGFAKHAHRLSIQSEIPTTLGANVIEKYLRFWCISSNQTALSK